MVAARYRISHYSNSIDLRRMDKFRRFDLLEMDPEHSFESIVLDRTRGHLRAFFQGGDL